MAGPDTLTITDDNFEQQITKGKGVALIDFWAPWCGPCKKIGPLVDEIATQYKNKVKVGKLDTDSSPRTATKFTIMSIPSILIFKDGKVYDKIMGLVPKVQITERLEKALAA
jgi:thioredoxin 1